MLDALTTVLVGAEVLLTDKIVLEDVVVLEIPAVPALVLDEFALGETEELTLVRLLVKLTVVLADVLEEVAAVVLELVAELAGLDVDDDDRLAELLELEAPVEVGEVVILLVDDTTDVVEEEASDDDVAADDALDEEDVKLELVVEVVDGAPDVLEDEVVEGAVLELVDVEVVDGLTEETEEAVLLDAVEAVDVLDELVSEVVLGGGAVTVTVTVGAAQVPGRPVVVSGLELVEILDTVNELLLLGEEVADGELEVVLEVVEEVVEVEVEVDTAVDVLAEDEVLVALEELGEDEVLEAVELEVETTVDPLEVPFEDVLESGDVELVDGAEDVDESLDTTGDDETTDDEEVAGAVVPVEALGVVDELVVVESPEVVLLLREAEVELATTVVLDELVCKLVEVIEVLETDAELVVAPGVLDVEDEV